MDIFDAAHSHNIPKIIVRFYVSPSDWDKWTNVREVPSGTSIEEGAKVHLHRSQSVDIDEFCNHDTGPYYSLTLRKKTKESGEKYLDLIFIRTRTLLGSNHREGMLNILQRSMWTRNIYLLRNDPPVPSALYCRFDNPH